MKRPFLLALAFCLCAAALAADAKSDVAAMFADYFQSYQRGDYAAAGRRIAGADLERFKQSLLPALLEAERSGSANAQKFSRRLLGGLAGKTADQIPAADFFGAFLAWVMDASPELKKAMAAVKVAIQSVELGADGQSAAINYHLDFGDYGQDANESAVLVDGAWYLRIKPGMEQAAERLRAKLKP